MRIVQPKSLARIHLATIEIGEAFRFKKPINGNMCPEDICIRIQVCSSYNAGLRDKHKGKIPIINLVTGFLSMVEPDRDVEPIDAEVHVVC